MSNTDYWDQVGTGESHEAIKWADIDVGVWVTGTIMDTPNPVSRPSLKDGSPELQLPINLDTKDGPRTLWVVLEYQNSLSSAIKKATVAAGGDTCRPEAGGKLAVRVTELRPSKYPKPARIYEAKYEQPKKDTEDYFPADEEPF